MPIFAQNGIKILFIHIPKTGGSSIEEYFINAGFEASLFSFTDFSAGCSPQHFHRGLLLERVDIKSFDAIFTIVREPLHRIVSEYKMLFRRLPVCTFTIWVRLILSKYRNHPFINDNHIRPQHEFIVPNTLIYHYELGLQNIMNQMFSDSGIDQSLFDFGEMPRVNVALSRAMPQMSEGDIAAIHSFYRRDYEEFHYPMDGESIGLSYRKDSA